MKTSTAPVPAKTSSEPVLLERIRIELGNGFFGEDEVVGYFGLENALRHSTDAVRLPQKLIARGATMLPLHGLSVKTLIETAAGRQTGGRVETTFRMTGLMRSLVESQMCSRSWILLDNKPGDIGEVRSLLNGCIWHPARLADAVVHAILHANRETVPFNGTPCIFATDKIGSMPRQLFFIETHGRRVLITALADMKGAPQQYIQAWAPHPES